MPPQPRREVAPLPKHQQQLNAQLQFAKVQRARHEQLVAQGRARSHAAGVVISSEAVKMLVAMGFAEAQAREALSEHRGSVNEATKALVAEEEAQTEATVQALAGPEEEQAQQRAAAQAKVATPVASVPQVEAAPVPMLSRVESLFEEFDPLPSQAAPLAAANATATLMDHLDFGGGTDLLFSPQPGAAHDWFATPPPTFCWRAHTERLVCRRLMVMQ